MHDARANKGPGHHQIEFVIARSRDHQQHTDQIKKHRQLKVIDIAIAGFAYIVWLISRVNRNIAQLVTARLSSLHATDSHYEHQTKSK